MNNLPKVVTQQRRGRAWNPRLLDRKSDALPLSHRATTVKDLYSALDDKHLVLKALRHGSHSLTCKPAFSLRTVYETHNMPFNPLNSKGSYSATSNNTKLVHWPLMGGLLHLVQ